MDLKVMVYATNNCPVAELSLSGLGTVTLLWDHSVSGWRHVSGRIRPDPALRSGARPEPGQDGAYGEGFLIGPCLGRAEPRVCVPGQWLASKYRTVHCSNVVCSALYTSFTNRLVREWKARRKQELAFRYCQDRSVVSIAVRVGYVVLSACRACGYDKRRNVRSSECVFYEVQVQRDCGK